MMIGFLVLLEFRVIVITTFVHLITRHVVVRVVSVVMLLRRHVLELNVNVSIDEV